MTKLLLLFLLFPLATRSQTQADDGGTFSRAAVPIWSGGERTIRSPDNTKAIVVTRPEAPDSDETHTVLVRAGGHRFRTSIGALVNSEVGWSPDSRAFFVTYSDGGNVGTYNVKVFYVTNSGLRVIEPVRDGRRLMKPNCFGPERPNIGAIGWVGGDSGELAVPPHSSCASMGTFKAFLLLLPSGNVMSEVDQENAKRQFADTIGSMLRDADDECARHAEGCIPCGMRGGDCGR